MDLPENLQQRFIADGVGVKGDLGSPEAAICHEEDDETPIGCYTPIGQKRQDLRNAAGTNLRLKTAWYDSLQLIAQASYHLIHNHSNSTGHSAMLHRLRAVLSVQLPLELTVHLMGTVQLTTYPDGRNLLLDYYEPDADENENTFVARVAWRFWDELSLVAQAAVYRSDFQFGTSNQPAFARETVLLGLAWDTWW